MIKRLDPKYTAIGLMIAAIIGALITWLSKLPFWASFMIVVVAMVLNGILAEYEDNLPGGFNNPMPEDEIRAVTQRKNKSYFTIRIGVWAIFILILIGFAWLYWNKGV